MQDITGEKPAMWGSSIVGFGTYHYKYASGQEGDWTPRKDNLTLYIMPGSRITASSCWANTGRACPASTSSHSTMSTCPR